MNPNAIESLRVILKKAKQICEQNGNKKAITEWIPLVELPVKREERRDVCEELERNGCISEVTYLGWQAIQCRVHIKIAEKCLQQES